MKYLILALSQAVAGYDPTFHQIMTQPSIMHIHACDDVLHDQHLFHRCMLPFIKTAQCRAFVHKQVFNDENMSTMTEHQLEARFMDLFRKCYNEY